MLPARSTSAGTCARTRDVEGSDHTVRSAQETVKHTARVVVVARDRACPELMLKGVECPGRGLVPAPGASKRDDGPVRSAQNTVNRIARVSVAS